MNGVWSEPSVAEDNSLGGIRLSSPTELYSIEDIIRDLAHKAEPKEIILDIAVSIDNSPFVQY